MKPFLSTQAFGLPPRAAVIAFLLVAVLVGLVSNAPVGQFDGYHRLADARPLLGIPNFWNVASNLPFLVVSLMGLALLRRRPPGASPAWATLFGATALVSFGSAYYHLDPRDATLVWDRLPMGLAFMGLLAAIIVEHSDERRKRAAQRLLLPMLALSIGAVYWWRFTGDLSLWIWIQLAPTLATALAVALLPAQYTHRRYYLYALACYAAAKGFELGDHQFLQWSGGLLSGHSLKHLAAAAAVAWLYAMLKKRQSLTR